MRFMMTLAAAWRRLTGQQVKRTRVRRIKAQVPKQKRRHHFTAQSGSYLRVLRILDCFGPLTVAEVSSRMDVQTTPAILCDMKKDGYVASVPLPRRAGQPGRRRHVYALTPSGQHLAAQYRHDQGGEDSHVNVPASKVSSSPVLN